MNYTAPNNLFFCFLYILVCVAFTGAQSTSQNFPTPVTASEINGNIKARDIGDSRVTTHYFALASEQGDLFLNITTKNFTGDIDVFTIDGLRPLTKIVVYSDFAENETGRIIYLRKPEKLLLRIQGRSPNDDDASYQVKFAGSFVALEASEKTAEPALPEIKADDENEIRVNSVGTIIPAPPKPVVEETVAAVEPAIEKAAQVETSEPAPTEKTPAAESSETAKAEAPESKTSMQVVITDNLPTEEKVVEPTPKTDPTTDISKEEVPAKAPKKQRTKVVKETLSDPLVNIQLVILFKDGKKIERPMSEVLKFTVDKGVLSVVSKDGSIGRYSILDVAKVTIE